MRRSSDLRDVRPSTIADPNGDKAFRTSTTCDLDHRDPIVIAVNNRLHDLTGIPREYGEPMQGQRYDVGQEFKAQTDYRSEEHTSELQSLMRISYPVFCSHKKTQKK